MFQAAFGLISVLTTLLIYKGYHREALILLTGTSFVIYPLLGPIIYLDIIFIFYLFFAFKTLTFSKNEIIIILALGITSFMSAMCYISTASVLQPLRLFEVIILLFVVSKISNKRNFDSAFLKVLLFLSLTSITLQILQIFSWDLAFTIKPIKSHTIGGWFKDSAQMGPFYLILFLWIKNTANYDNYPKAILLALCSINVIISTNRTSLFILILVIAYMIMMRLSLKLLFASALMMLVFISNVEILGAKIYNTYLSVVKGDFRFDTLSLRLDNWVKIYSYATNHCNIFFGCGYSFIEDNAIEISAGGKGMFTFDNMFVRYFIENGLIGGVLKTLLYLGLLVKANIRYLIPMFLLALTQEATEDLTLFIPTLVLLYKSQHV
jgi:hypothetical protein